jgi:hypothetical protein
MNDTLAIGFTPPGTAPAEDPGPPRGAVIEIVERHDEEKKPYSGVASIIVPNHVRINGVAVWATYEAPVTIEELVIDGSCRSPFTVTVRLNARRLKVGGTPAFDEGAERGGDVGCAAVVEIPDTDGWSDGDVIDRPYVLLNGRRIWTAGPVRVGPVSTHNIASVTLTLVCRSLLVDDEPRTA